jgi:hypothetical protein
VIRFAQVIGSGGEADGIGDQEVATELALFQVSNLRREDVRLLQSHLRGIMQLLNQLEAPAMTGAI